MARQVLPLPWTRATSIVMCAELEKGRRATAFSDWFRVRVSFDAGGAVLAAGSPVAIPFRSKGLRRFRVGEGSVRACRLRRVEGKGFVLSCA